MKIRKNSILGILLQIILVVSFILLFAEFNSIILYIFNLLIFWFTATITENYIK